MYLGYASEGFMEVMNEDARAVKERRAEQPVSKRSKPSQLLLDI